MDILFKKSDNGNRKKKTLAVEVCSDYELLIDSVNKGKITPEILKNCDLMYICKTCRTIYTNLLAYSIHHYKCIANKQEEESKISLQNLECKISATTVEKSSKTIVSCQAISLNNISYNKDSKGKNSKTPQREVKYKAHTQRHDENTFPCTKCGRNFQCQSNLKQHMAVVHTDFRKYKCNFCEFRANSKGSCTDHLNRCHMRNAAYNFDKMVSKAACINGKVIYVQSPSPSTPTSSLGANLLPTIKKLRTELDESDSDNNNDTDLSPVKSEVMKEKGSNSSAITKWDEILSSEVENIVIKCEPPNEIMEEVDPECAESGIVMKCRKGFEGENDITQSESQYILVLSDMQEKLLDAEKLMCLMCNKTFPRITELSELRFHLAVMHFGFKKFRCNKCNFTSNCSNACTLHAFDVHKRLIGEKNFDALFWTLQCKNRADGMPDLDLALNDDQSFNTKSEYATKGFILLNEQESKFVNMDDLTCRICKSGYRFTNKWAVKSHVAVKHFGYKRYKCRNCDEFQSNFAKECREHLVEFHGMKPTEIHRNVLKMFKENTFLLTNAQKL